MAGETDGGGADLAGVLTGGSGDAGAGGNGGGGDAGAGGGDAGAGGAGSGNGGGDASWLDIFSADADGEGSSFRDWVKSKGFKDPNALAKSYRDTEKALRESGRVKVPGDGAPAEEVTAYRKAIGVPDDAKGYEIKGPEGVELNAPLIDRLAAAAHKAGIPKSAFEATVQDYIQSQMDEAHAESQRQNGLASAKLKEWGDKATANLASVNTAARALGLTDKEMSGLRTGLGADRALDLLAKLGNGMAEDRLVGGDGSRFGISPAEAQKEIEAMKVAPGMFAKVQLKGSPEALRWERLNGVIAAEEDRKARAA